MMYLLEADLRGIFKVEETEYSIANCIKSFKDCLSNKDLIPVACWVTYKEMIQLHQEYGIQNAETLFNDIVDSENNRQ